MRRISGIGRVKRKTTGVSSDLERQYMKEEDITELEDRDWICKTINQTE